VPQPPALKEGNATLLAQATRYVNAIMNPEDDSFPRLSCPATNIDRYAMLRPQSEIDNPNSSSRQFFFALDLHQCAELLPRLLGSIVQVARFLGTQNCALSIVEGRSTDGTFEILKALGEDLDNIGFQYYLNTSEIDPFGSGHRIEALAELRNMALRPLIDQQLEFAEDATVVFLNDVAACPDDILELVYQRAVQNADMTCAMDWTYVGPDPTFYDVWVARGMTGDSFFRIPPDGSWDSAWNLFWNDDAARARLHAGKPFQVFSCWNGAVAFPAKPIVAGQIKFRAHYDAECYQGEPKLFCKDMWANGYGKIAVVPSVNLEYSDEAGKKIKDLKGYVQRWTGGEGDDIKISWKEDPPEKVKCMPAYDHQEMIPWDEGLPNRNGTG